MVEVTKHLNALVLSEHIRPWTDRCLEPGDLWEPQILEKLRSADIIIILVSADYWSSNYAAKDELAVAIERGKAGQAAVIPIILRPCMWRNSPIAEFQVLPANGGALSNAPNIDEALAEITENIYALAKAINERRSKEIGYAERGGDQNRVRDLLSPGIPPKKPVVRLLKAFPHSQRVVDAAFNRTGTILATACDDGRVRTFNVRTLEQETIMHARPQSLRSVSWSRGGREIATGDSDGSVRIWRDGAEKRRLPISDGGSVWNAEYDREGGALAVASEDGSVSVWNPRRPQLRWRRQIHEKSVNSVRFNFHGNQIVTSSSDGTAAVLDAANGRELCRFSKHEDQVSISLFVSTALEQEVCCMSAGADGRLFLWNTSDVEQSVEVARHSFWVRALTCSVEGDFVVSGGYDADLKFIDLESGEVFGNVSVDHGPIYCTRLSDDGSLLLVSAEDCNAYLFVLKR